MNLLEIRSGIRLLVSETLNTPVFIDDMQLNEFINEGIKDACVKGLIFSKTKTIPATTTVASYQLPFDFLKAISLQNPSFVPLIVISPDERNLHYIITGKPLYYFVTQTHALNTTRANGATYTAGTLLNPATANGFMYEVTVAGTVGGAPPTYPIKSGTSVTDGTATLVCRELIIYNNALTLVDTPTTAGGGTGTYTLIYNALDEGLHVDTDAPNFPWDKHYALTYYGAFKVSEREKDATLASTFLKEYAAILGLSLSGDVKGAE